MEDPGGSEQFEYGGWSFEFSRGEEGDQFKLDETMASEALLLGRVTYEGFAEAWPSREGEFADKFNQMPKYVVSSSLGEPEWENSTVLRGDLAEEVEQVKARHDAVESRTTRRVASSRWSVSKRCRSRRRTRRLTAVRPISSSGWRTVVSAGVTIVACSTSSKPTTDMSSGTRRPRARAAWIAPIAWLSLKAKIAVGGSGRSSRRPAARAPPPISKSASTSSSGRGRM